MKNRIAIRGRRKELRKAIRERRSLVKLAEYIDEEFVEDGKVTIRVNVDELYRPMSMGNLRQLNGDIFDYVEHCVNLVPSLIPLRVVFHGVEEKDREHVPELFRLHYDAELQDLINAALYDLKTNGVDALNMQTDALVVQAVKTYCRAHFHSPADYDKLLSAYEEQKGHLMNCTGYTVFPTEVIPDGAG